MKIIITENVEEMSKVAKDHMLGFMLQDKRVNLSITGGSTPKRMYELVVPEVKGKKYFDNVHYYNFDEIPYKKEDREGVTISELRKSYFTPAAIPEDQIHILDQHNYAGQDERIKNDGGLDAVILGLGSDGHFCGNLPNTTKFGDLTSRVECDDYLKGRILDDFDGQEEYVPDYYITMGPRSIMMAKKLVMIVSGSKKAKIVKEIAAANVTEDIPATVLSLHPNFTLILDKEAASEIR
ncbi:glucosamine-6-phosphate deaminase [Listeria kieliensis]